MKYRRTAVWTALLCLALGGPALAADKSSGSDQSGSGVVPHTGSITATEEASNAREVVLQAADIVERLRTGPETQQTLKEAKAIFIVPDYTRAALGVGGAGGQGVLVANNDGKWSAPAFYNVGTINMGLEAGVEAGSIAFFLMSDDAMKGFEEENNFSLSADAGITIVNWSKRAQASAGKPDVIAWSDTEGLYGDLAVSVTDIFRDEEANYAFYQERVSARDIIAGRVQPPAAANELESEFSALESGGTTDQQKQDQSPIISE